VNGWAVRLAPAVEKRIAWLVGDDVFISYSRVDGATYAAGLASELAHAGLSCRFDQWGSEPGKEVPKSLLRALRRSSMLVIVGTAAAGQSAAVGREIEEFVKTKRLIVPLDLDASISNSRWWPAIEGLAVSREGAGEAAMRTTPSAAILDRIQNSISFTRRNRRLQIAATATGALIAVLLIAAGVAGVITDRARTELTGVRRALDASREDFTRQKGLTEAATQERIQAEALAAQARAQAQQADGESQAEQLALQGEASLETDPQKSLKLAMEAVKLTANSTAAVKERPASLLRRAVLATPRRLAGDAKGVECFSIRPGGRSIAVGTQHSEVREYSLPDGRLLRTYPIGGWVDTVAWSPGGDLLAAGARNKMVVIWKAQDGSVNRTIPLDNDPQSLDWRMDGTQLAAGLANGNTSRTRVFDTRSFAVSFEVEGMIAAWSPDGKRLATGGGDGTVHLFTAAGQEIASLAAHNRYVGSISWDKAGTRFATASVDDTVMVWDAAKPARIAKLADEFALSVAWSPDGRYLASGAGTSFVRVWETSGFRPIFDLSHAKTIGGDDIAAAGSIGYVMALSWLSDGKTLIIADRDGGILLYSSRILTAKTDDDWVEAASEQLKR
jgi:hypothetical protein